MISSLSLKNALWSANSNPPVNKRVLSTGETGEFGSKYVGSGLNPGVERAAPEWRVSNVREPAEQIPAECLEYGEPIREASSTQTATAFGAIGRWLPGMDSNHDSRLQRPLSYH